MENHVVMVDHIDENERLLSMPSPFGGASSEGNSPGMTGSLRSFAVRFSFFGALFLTTPLVVDWTLSAGSCPVTPVTLSRGMVRAIGICLRSIRVQRRR